MQVSFGPRSCTNEKVVEVFKLSSHLFPFLSSTTRSMVQEVDLFLPLCLASAQLKVDLERFVKVARQ